MFINLYRLENSEGYGPVRLATSESPKILLDLLDKRIAAHHEFRNFRPGVQMCACPTPEDLIDYFTEPVLAELAELGYRMVEILIPEDSVEFGNSQCIYFPQRVIRKEIVHA